MRISWNWLKKYTGIDANPEEIAEILTSCGLEVESIEHYESVKGGLRGVVIGKVLECNRHRNADKLTVTRVDVGHNEPLQIVCGAPNVRAGQKVPVATVGTTLFFGEKELVIRSTTIRGELSEGMICAEDELGLGTSHDGIMELDPEAPVGMPVAEYFNVTADIILEIGLTPNRADAASYIGVARDLVAAWNMRHFHDPTKWASLHLPDISAFTVHNNSLPIPVTVLNPEACPRYSGITISNLNVHESPEWLKEFLKVSGLRPINNVVDVTNFVLLELGQPLHAFDVAKMEGQQVVVRKMPQGTPFITLDGVERTLTDDDLMICNATSPMCIGGVFGGLTSGVSATTTEIFLESACFDPGSIRKTSKHHGLKTDASFRFERGSDPNITVFALKRAALLLQEVAAGEVTSPVVDVYPEPIPHFRVPVRYENITRLIGKQLPNEMIHHILGWLGIEITEMNENGFTAFVPPSKPDVNREADIIEEILRIYGYNNVEIDLSLRSSISITEKPDRHKLMNLVADYLASNGYYEIMCNSLSKTEYIGKIPFMEESLLVRILNPISRELDCMRQSLIVSGLETILYNTYRKNPDLKLFEFGKVYFRNRNDDHARKLVGNYSEEWRLGLFVTGHQRSETWYWDDQPADFFQLKAALNGIFERLGISGMVTETVQGATPGFDYSLAYVAGNSTIALAGKFNQEILTYFDIKQEVYAAEIFWEKCLALLSHKEPLKFSEIPRFPSVRRDLALLVDKNITFAKLQQIARKAGGSIVKEINLFDIYEGERIGQGKKSYALSFIIQDEQKTLKDEETDAIMKRIIDALDTEAGAKLRQ